MFKKFIEEQRLEQLKNKLKPASMRNENKCVQCGFCCQMRTCIPMPNEIKKIARYLKMDTKKCINKYFAIDGYPKEYYFRPVGENIEDLAGRYIPDYRTFNEGKCIFLKQRGEKYFCKIHKVKPMHAKTTLCWAENKQNPKYGTEEIIKLWKNDILQKKFNIEVTYEDNYNDENDDDENY